MKGVIVSVCVAAAALWLSCGGEEGVTKPTPERPEPTTPARVLKNVEIAFNQRDIGLLKAMLSENFVFYFDPNDIGSRPPGGKYIIPESWGYTELWQAIYNLFQKAYAIDMAINTDNVGAPAPGANTYCAENISVSLTVMVDPSNGFIVDGYCNFAFERYAAANGKNYWRLTKWWDHTCQGFDGPRTSEPTSLGRIFALYK